MKARLGRLKLLVSNSASQKKSMIWALKFGGLLVVFLAFFFPVTREFGAAASNIASHKEQISSLKQMSINLLTPEELASTEKRLDEFETKLMESSRAASLLDFVSAEAEKNHFSVIQIYSDSPSTLKDDRGMEMTVRGKKLMLLPVNFRVETDFKSFGNFLKSMKDNTPAEFVVESMSLKKTSPESESLQCDMTVSFVVT